MGLSDEKNLPLTWGGKNQENVLWKAPLFRSDKVKRDQNQSSPIVWGERVFVTVSFWSEGASDKDFPEHHVLCFNTKDGTKLWDTLIPPGPWKLSDLRGGYTAPTPATDGERVYAAFGSSVVAAIDMAGKIVWRKEIAPFHFDVAWSASPVVQIVPPNVGPGAKRDVSVFVVCDQLKDKKSSTIYAFDGPTGKVRWECKRPDVDWAHSTPLLAKVNRKWQLITATANGPQSIDPTNGNVLWTYRTQERVGDTVTPVVRDGFAYVDSGRGGGLSGGGLLIDATRLGDLDAKRLKWKLPTVPAGFSSPLVYGDYLYRLHDPGVLSCFKWATGEEVYKERLEGVDSAISPFATADGRIYCAGAGKSYVLKAGTTPEILGKGDLGDASRASPAVAAGRIYLKGSRFLYCIGTK
jgi:outer membrane protein assembly factor BamB